MSVDRFADKYPNWNPYNYTLNNPVRLVDPNGAAPQDIVVGGVKWSPGLVGKNESKFIQQTFAALNKLVSYSDVGNTKMRNSNNEMVYGNVIKYFIEGGKFEKNIVNITESHNGVSSHGEDNSIAFAPTTGLEIIGSKGKNLGKQSASIALIHELAHEWFDVVDFKQSEKNSSNFFMGTNGKVGTVFGHSFEHDMVLKVENFAAKSMGQGQRKEYKSARWRGVKPIIDFFGYRRSDVLYKTKNSTSIENE